MPFPIVDSTPQATTHASFHNAYVDVKAHYAAVGDGVTDDGPACRSALAAVASGGTVYFPPGTYLLASLDASTDCLNLGNNDNISIIGAGIGVTTLKVGVASWRSIIRGDQSDNIVIRDMTLDGNKASFAGNLGQGLRFLSTAADQIRISNVEIKNTDDRSASITAKRVWVDKCWIHNNDGGLGFNDSTDMQVWVTDNLIHDIGIEWTAIQDAIYFGGQYATFRGNHIFGATDTGINIGGATDPTGWVRATGNLIYKTGNSGINTGGGDNQVITDNIIFACGRKTAVPRSNAGIRIRDDGSGTFTSNGVVVRGNRCYEDVTNYPLQGGALGQLYGVELANASGGGMPADLIVSENDLRGNTTTAVYIPAAASNIIVLENLTGTANWEIVDLKTVYGLVTGTTTSANRIANTAALNRAFSENLGLQKRLLLPNSAVQTEGTVGIDVTSDTGALIELFGHGRSTSNIYNFAAGVPTMRFRTTSGNLRDLYVHDFKIRGQSAVADYGLELSKVGYSVFDRLTLWTCAGMFIDNSSFDLNLNELWFLNISGYSVEVVGSSSAIFTNCVFGEDGGSIRPGGSSRLHIYNSYFRNCLEKVTAGGLNGMGEALFHVNGDSVLRVANCNIGMDASLDNLCNIDNGTVSLSNNRITFNEGNTRMVNIRTFTGAQYMQFVGNNAELNDAAASTSMQVVDQFSTTEPHDCVVADNVFMCGANWGLTIEDTFLKPSNRNVWNSNVVRKGQAV